MSRQLVHETALDEDEQLAEMVTGTQLVHVEGLTVEVAIQDDGTYVGQLVGAGSVIVVGGKKMKSVVVVVDVLTDDA